MKIVLKRKAAQNHCDDMTTGQNVDSLSRRPRKVAEVERLGTLLSAALTHGMDIAAPMVAAGVSPEALFGNAPIEFFI